MQLHKGVKLVFGYQNAALYNFNNRKVYLISKESAYQIENSMRGEEIFLSVEMLQRLHKYGLIVFDDVNAELNPTTFEYDLFDDAYSAKVCKLLYIEVTDTCNYNCIHCYADAQRMGKKFLPVDNMCTILSQVKNGMCDIRLTGGEPFMHPKLQILLDKVYFGVKPIKRHSIVTNGSFNFDDAIYALKLGFELQVSLYGMTPKTFCRFTQSDEHCLEKVMENLCCLAKTPYKDRILLCFAVNHLTYEEIDLFREFADMYGFSYILNRPASIGRAVKNWDVLELSNEEHYNFARMTQGRAPRYCYHLCEMHLTAIDIDGNVSPCSFLRDKAYIMGNIYTGSLDSIWESSRYCSFRNLTATDVDKCNFCEFVYACTAGCCGEAAGYTGSLVSTYPWCKIRPFDTSYLSIRMDEIYLAEKLAAGTFEFIKLY